MNKEQIRLAIIRDIDNYFSAWGSVHYANIGSNMEIIVNKHFGYKRGKN